MANIISQTLHIEHLILKLLKGVWQILVINKYYVIVVNSLRLCAQVEQDALWEKMMEGNTLDWFNWKTSMPLTTQVIV